MCKGSSNTTTQSTSSSPNPQAMALYRNLLTKAQGVANTPYTPYGGQLVAPVNAQQNTGIAGINNNANFAIPYVQNALQMATGAGAPITGSDINQFANPWQNAVTNATINQMTNLNNQQLQAVKGNAVAQGALGGNREAVAEAATTGQQAAAEAPVIAGIQSQGFNTALTAAEAQKQQMLGAAYGMGSLGVAGENAGLTGANAQIGAGSLEQGTQQAQDTAAYQQFLQQLAYPFQTTQWLAGIGTGVGSQMGGTSQGTTTGPAPSMFSQILGGGLGATSMLGMSGAFGSSGWLPAAMSAILPALARGGRVKGYADGGVVGSDDPSIPESPDTLDLQQQALQSGNRVAQMFPNGTDELPVPDGMNRVDTPDGPVHYNPNRISANEIIRLSGMGRQNDFLGLGPYSKDQVLKRVAAGETPVAVVERDRNGTEVRAAIGTTKTAPEQIAAMNRDKLPGSTIRVEDPVSVANGRMARVQPNQGVLSRQTGGEIPIDPAAGVAGMPYSGGTGWIPGISITRGPGAPHAGAPSAPQQPNPINQGMQIGNLAKQISGSFPSMGNANPTGTTYAGPDYGGPLNIDTPSYWGGGVEGVSTPYRRGGGVSGYADGGGPDFDAEFGAFDQPVTGILPDNINGVPTAAIGQTDGFAPAPVDAQVIPPDKVPLPKARPADVDVPVDTAGVVPAAEPVTGLAPIQTSASDYGRPTEGFQDNLTRYGQASAGIESGGRYDLVGPATRNGDHGYGKYQVMGNNVGPWTAEVLGRSMTPQQFLNDPQAQEAVYRAKFGQLANKYGPEGAARAWYAGEKGMNNLDATAHDINGRPLGLTVGDYGKKFMAALGQPGGGVGPADLPSHATPAQYTGTQGVVPSSGPNFGANSNLWPALAAAGFGMMASRSPFPGVAIGEGALTGMQTAASMQKAQQEQALKQQDIALRVKQMSNEADRWQRDYALKSLPYKGVLTAEQQANLAYKQAEINLKASEPKPFFDPESSQMHYSVRRADGSVYDITNGRQLLGPGGTPPQQASTQNPAAGGQSSTQQNGMPVSAPGGQQPSATLQSATFRPDDVMKAGTWKVNSMQTNAGQPYDYSTGQTPYIEKGMAVPEPKPVAGKSADTIKTEAERYLLTGKAPVLARGNSPVAMMQNAYASSVMNYANALAGSRGTKPEELAQLWQTSPMIGRFLVGQPGQQIVSLGTAMRHLETLKEYEAAWQKAKLGDTQPLNRLQAYISAQWGSEAATNLNTVAHILGPEIVKAIGVAGAGTADDRKGASEQFTTAGSDQQVNGAIAATERLLKGQLIGKANQAKSVGLSDDRFKKLIGEKEYQSLRALDAGGQQPGANGSTPAQPTRVIQNGWIYEKQPDGSMKPVGKAQQ